MKEPRPDKQSYAEAMSEWTATRERTLFSRTRNPILHPDPMASLPGRVVGYVWRGGVLLAALAGVYYFFLMWHMRQDSFSGMLAGEAAGFLAAEKAEMSALHWRKNRAAARKFTAVGGPRAFFRTIEAENVDFRVPLRMMFQKAWKLDFVGVGAARIELRSGGVSAPLAAGTPASTGPKATPPGLDGPPPTTIRTEPGPDPVPPPDSGRKVLDLRLYKNGFGVSPSFDDLVVDEVQIARADFTWGLTEFTRGAVLSASALAHPLESGWQIVLNGGRIEQNWLRGLEIKKLVIHCGPKAVRIQEGLLGAGDGTATLIGEVTTGEFPRVDLKLECRQVAVEHFLAEPVASWVRGKASGPITIGGSINTAGGISTRGALKLESGTLRSFPMLNTLAVVTGRGRFRDLGLSGGSIEFTTGEGRLEVQSLELQSGNDVVIRGRFACHLDQFTGMVRLGMSRDLAQRIPADVKQKLFREESDGLVWIDVPLEGPVETLTKEPSNGLADAYQRASR
jgi:hypothetical protein